MPLLDKLIPLIEKGDKKSIAKARELIEQGDIDIPEPKPKKPVLKKNGKIQIEEFVEAIKCVDDLDTLKLLKHFLAERIKIKKYSKK